ncbi:MAG: glycosyltransferase [bacterium]
MHKRKVLVALFRLPYPATDGTRFKILHNLVSGLKKEFEVEFFVVNIKSYTQSDIDHLEQNYGKVHVFHRSKLAYLFNAFPALYNGLPLQAQAFHFKGAQKWLDVHIDDYDAVYIHEIRMTEFFINYSDVQKQKFLVDFNDAISMNYQAGVQKMNVFKKLFYTWEGNRVARYESQVLTTFNHFSIVSEVDKKYLLNAPAYHGSKNLDFSVVNHGAPIPSEVATCDQHKIFFMGSLDYEPNRDAVRYLIETIWPQLSVKIPEVELVIIGGGTIPESYKHIPRIIFSGFVPNVFEVVRHCKALVAPIRFAGGTPSKIIEAMGYGIPVVTTPQGAAGISGIEPGNNIITVSEQDVDAWVEIINKLIQDSNYLNAIARKGRLLVEERYSQQAAEQVFCNRLKEVADSIHTL